MATLSEIREQYPQYGDMTDAALADALYSKYYSDLPRDEFNVKIGLQTAPAAGENPTDVVKRGSILPLGRTREGSLVPAAPEFIAGPMQTIKDLAEGKRQPQEITGKEIFELGALFSGAPAGSNRLGLTGAGAASREAAPVAAAAVPDAPPPAIVAEAAPAARTVIPEVAGATTPAEFRAAASGFYKKVDDAGVTISGKGFRPVYDEIVTAARKHGLDEMLTPDSARALTRLAEATKQPIPFSEFDTLLQIVGNAKGAVRAKDKMIAQQIEDKLDDFIANLSSKDVVGGDARVVSEFLPKAKDLWSRFRKLETVEGMVERAGISAPNFSASGMENALRTEFRILAKNKAQIRKWTPDEQKAIRKIAQGGFRENVARNVGRFAPTGPVSASIGIGAPAALAGSVLGPIGGFAVGAAGATVAYGARRLATALTKRNVAALEKIVRDGGATPAIERSIARGRSLLALIEKTLPAATGEAAVDLRR